MPQHRERIVIVGFDKERYGENVSFSFDLHPLKKHPVVRDILEKEVSEKYTLSDKLWIYLQNYAAKHREAGNGLSLSLIHILSVPYAYKLIRELNEELRETGCITIAGRIDRKFFHEKFYGTREAKERRESNGSV